MNTPNDTIVAPATAVGGAIAVVRMSGPSALAICDTVFSGARKTVTSTSSSTRAPSAIVP